MLLITSLNVLDPLFPTVELIIPKLTIHQNNQNMPPQTFMLWLSNSAKVVDDYECLNDRLSQHVHHHHNMTLHTTSIVPLYYGLQSGWNTLFPVYSLKPLQKCGEFAKIVYKCDIVEEMTQGRVVYPDMVICCNPHYTLKRMLQMRGFTHPNYNRYQLNNYLNKNFAVFSLLEHVIFNTEHCTQGSNFKLLPPLLAGMCNHQSCLHVVCWSCVNYILCL